MGERHPSFLTRIRIGLQGVTQEPLAPVQSTEIIDAALKEALRIDHGVADPEGPRPVGYHATESLCFVEVLLVCSARFGIWDDTTGGIVVLYTPAVSQLIGVLGLLPVWHHIVILPPTVEVTAHATGPVEIGGGHLHFHRVIGVIGNPQSEICLQGNVSSTPAHGDCPTSCAYRKGR